jgi:signal peptidase I
MVPTILPSDRLWVDRLAHPTAQPPHRGQIIVFRHRGDGDTDGDSGALVKRVIGLPGDRITMIDSRPVINGRVVPSCDAGSFVYYGTTQSSRGHLVVEWLEGEAYLTIHELGPHQFDEYEVKPGEVFVLGDNRGVSNDSRSWQHGRGVALADIEGRVERVLFGADRGGRLDLGRLWRRLGTDLHVTGVDLAPLRAGIERCLQEPLGSSPSDQLVKTL